MCFDYKVQGAGAGGGIHEFRMLFKPARWSVDFCLRKSEGGGSSSTMMAFFCNYRMMCTSCSRRAHVYERYLVYSEQLLTWSPCRCEMKMREILPGRTALRISWICDPSPQSNIQYTPSVTRVLSQYVSTVQCSRQYIS